MTHVETPAPGRGHALAFVGEHLGRLFDGEPSGSGRFRGGQSRADAALAGYDVTGYAARRNEVWPSGRRGASELSPYIRHNLLTLARVWDHVAGGPSRDVAKFRDELMWQEHARHWYARLGPATGRGTRAEQVAPIDDGGWDQTMACVDLAIGELHGDGWMVNQTRMWMASHWAVREGLAWRDGEDDLHRHLLDGSRAANRLGWQWTTGVGSRSSYGFSRRQVRRRAPGLCDRCPHADDCPIESWPPDPDMTTVLRPEGLRGVGTTEAVAEAGPSEPDERSRPEVVWLTVESMGDDDPALVAHPELPVVFVFDQPLLARLRLDAKRLVFWTETLAELGEHRDLEIHLGDVVEVLRSRRPAVTFAPVPGFARRSAAIGPAVVHPWPWLVRPSGGTVASFSAWRRAVGGRPRR